MYGAVSQELLFNGDILIGFSEDRDLFKQIEININDDESTVMFMTGYSYPVLTSELLKLIEDGSLHYVIDGVNLFDRESAAKER